MRMTMAVWCVGKRRVGPGIRKLSTTQSGLWKALPLEPAVNDSCTGGEALLRSGANVEPLEFDALEDALPDEEQGGVDSTNQEECQRYRIG